MKHIIITFILIIITISFRAQAVIRTYKTLNEAKYEVGDLILAPQIWFDVSTCEMLPESQDSVKIIANFMDKHPGFIIEIGIHSDNRLDPETTMMLSKCRAKTVFTYLTKDLHSSKKGCEAKGYGFTEPIADEDMIRSKPSHRNYFDEKNRRVELKILLVK